MTLMDVVLAEQLEEDHDNAIYIDDFIGLTRNIKPYIADDQNTVREIIKAEKAKGVVWGKSLGTVLA
jgi:hypothetical protein